MYKNMSYFDLGKALSKKTIKDELTEKGLIDKEKN